MSASIEPAYEYRAVVVRWVDGDTVDLRVDLGFYSWLESRFRLYGIDVPERGHPDWITAKAKVNELAPAGYKMLIRTYKSTDKYGRFLAELILPEPVGTVNSALIAAGLAKPYFGGPR